MGWAMYECLLWAGAFRIDPEEELAKCEAL